MWYQKLFWPFTVRINHFGDLKVFSNSWPSTSNFKNVSQTLQQFFLTVGQNNFCNKIPSFIWYLFSKNSKISWNNFHVSFHLHTDFGLFSGFKPKLLAGIKVLDWTQTTQPYDHTTIRDHLSWMPINFQQHQMGLF